MVDEKELHDMAPAHPKDYSDDSNSVYTMEAPPAYQKPKSTTVQLAKTASFTFLGACVILGLCLVASAWIQTRGAVCPAPAPAVRAAHQQETASRALPLTAGGGPQTQASPEQKEPVTVPVDLNLDAAVGKLIERHMGARMECVVEKRTSEEVVDQKARNLSLPFGLDASTDPRQVRVTGERMSMSCRDGDGDSRPNNRRSMKPRGRSLSVGPAIKIFRGPPPPPLFQVIQHKNARPFDRILPPPPLEDIKHQRGAPRGGRVRLPREAKEEKPGKKCTCDCMC